MGVCCVSASVLVAFCFQASAISNFCCFNLALSGSVSANHFFSCDGAGVGYSASSRLCFRFFILFTDRLPCFGSWVYCFVGHCAYCRGFSSSKIFLAFVGVTFVDYWSIASGCSSGVFFSFCAWIGVVPFFFGSAWLPSGFFMGGCISCFSACRAVGFFFLVAVLLFGGFSLCVIDRFCVSEVIGGFFGFCSSSSYDGFGVCGTSCLLVLLAGAFSYCRGAFSAWCSDVSVWAVCLSYGFLSLYVAVTSSLFSNLRVFFTIRFSFCVLDFVSVCHFPFVFFLLAFVVCLVCQGADFGVPGDRDFVPFFGVCFI
ncbi:porin [Escherichia coli]|uniref:porin n=1 Tax=Escherichia coli TaxID=562 RepID=UPI00159322FF|nr:porin [Escherichia coli]